LSGDKAKLKHSKGIFDEKTNQGVEVRYKLDTKEGTCQ
jgi:hypothetical protein